MKKVVIINSTPRVNGNSECLCKEFARGAKEAGHRVNIINLRDYNLKYCLACYACKETLRCIHNDGMNEISEMLEKADVIVLSTPVYFYSMSGQLKVFIDRLIPTYRKIKADIYLIATQWDASNQYLERTLEAIRGCTKECFYDCEEKGVIYGTCLGDKGEVYQRECYLAEAYELGKKC